jgi:uncharacterized protein YaiE (UPF0345 family)
MTAAHVVGGVALRAGVRLVVAEADYLYGTGAVTIVVGGVDRLFCYAGDDWVELRAGEVLTGGVTIARLISVRVSALRAAVRDD